MLKPFFTRKLTINGKKIKIPIQLGGMAVKIGTSRLAATIANEGGVGLIGASGMQPYELQEEMQKARELTDGIIGVNIMVPLKQFKELVNVSVKEGADLLVFAAGMPKKEFVKEVSARIPCFLIISDPRHIGIANLLGFAGVILESGKAGGHLGTGENVTLADLIPKAIAVIEAKRVKEKNPNFILTVAGGIFDSQDVSQALNFADLVQIGSRLAVSVESNADINWKNLMINSTRKDLVIIKSPVGLPFRAVKNLFVERLMAGQVKPLNDQFRAKRCRGCLDPDICSGIYCIFDRLSQAQKGDLKKGLFTIGDNIDKITKIEPAAVIIKDLMSKVKPELTAAI